MTIGHTLENVMISIRLDQEAVRALKILEAAGRTRSEAVRQAILDSAERMRSFESLAAESAALEANEEDRREMLAIAAYMEEMAGPDDF